MVEIASTVELISEILPGDDDSIGVLHQDARNPVLLLTALFVHKLVSYARLMHKHYD